MLVARDLVLKLYNFTNEMVKTSMLAEMAIVYEIDKYQNQNEDGLSRAEIFFIRGEYKRALSSNQYRYN